LLFVGLANGAENILKNQKWDPPGEVVQERRCRVSSGSAQTKFLHSGKVSSGECDKFDPDLLHAQPRPSDGLGRALVQVLKVVHVVAHCDEEVEEHPAPGLHLHLHGAAALEGAARADDEREVMSAQGSSPCLACGRTRSARCGGSSTPRCRTEGLAF